MNENTTYELTLMTLDELVSVKTALDTGKLVVSGDDYLKLVNHLADRVNQVHSLERSLGIS